MNSLITILGWKLILMSALTALAGSVFGVVIIKTGEPAKIEFPSIELPAETFEWVKPINSGRHKEF